MGVTSLEITHRSVVLDGRPFGPAGAYEKITGVLRLGIDPVHETRELERFPRRHHVAVHDVELAAGLPHVQPRQRAPSAADGIKGAAFAAFQQAGVFWRQAGAIPLLKRLVHLAPVFITAPGKQLAQDRPALAGGDPLGQRELAVVVRGPAHTVPPGFG